MGLFFAVVRRAKLAQSSAQMETLTVDGLDGFADRAEAGAVRLSHLSTGARPEDILIVEADSVEDAVKAAYLTFSGAELPPRPGR